MSFRKFQRFDPNLVGNPDPGHVYIGQSSINGFCGFWQKDEWGTIFYLPCSGTTTGTTSQGTSGTSGKDGTSGVNGEFYGSSGTSGNNGSSGINGISGSSGRDGQVGTAGTSGISGTHGTSGTNGVSGSSGTSGISGSSGITGSSGTSGSSAIGSSGTSGNTGSSGTSGLDGAYGGATRVWEFSTSSSVANGQFYSSEVNIDLLTEILISDEDYDGQDITSWVHSWNGGILKIEEWRNLNVFCIYTGVTSTTYASGIHKLNNFTLYNSQGTLENNKIYLISFVPGGMSGGGEIGTTSGTSGSSGISGDGSSGTSGTSGSSGISHSLFSWVIDSPEVGGIPGPRLYYDMNILRVDSYITDITGDTSSPTSGVTFNIEDRSTIGSTGIEILSPDLTSYLTGTTVTTSYSMNSDNWLYLNIKSINGYPDKFVVTLAGN